VSLKLDGIVESSKIAKEERSQMREDNTNFKNEMLRVTDDMRIDLNAKVNDILRQNSIIENKVI
jgi:hypothetical protein